MTLEKRSPCKVNLLLNILGRRPDGFHELETIIHPVNLCDHLTFSRIESGLELTCNRAELPTDAGNLVHRAAGSFFAAAGIPAGVRIHLEKHVPIAAGLGGGSANAAVTLEALNELYDQRLSPTELCRLAAALGSDVPFFLQPCPALATGRGEHVVSLEVFPALKGTWFLLIRPDFGIATAWAYQQLSRFPSALNGRPGRAQKLLDTLQGSDLRTAGAHFYNSLEAGCVEKYPWLALLQEYMKAEGAPATLMSGSGSTTFALFETQDRAETMARKVKERLGPVWSAVVPV